jgi:hypothetical protein
MSRFDDSEPEDLAAWLAAGLRRTDAKSWRGWNFTIDEALTWRKANVREALTAAQWQAAGVTPGMVEDWTAAGISSSEAVRWNEFGYTLEQARDHVKEGRGPNEAYEQRQQTTTTRGMRFVSSYGSVAPERQQAQRFFTGGVPHNVMGGYLETRWLDDEAYEWAKQGVRASDAKIWIKIGLVPAEIKDLPDPLQVVEDWWRSGIPFEEVADWLGAGLTAAEAVEQRAAGVTREQAAALRALRRGA